MAANDSKLEKGAANELVTVRAWTAYSRSR